MNLEARPNKRPKAEPFVPTTTEKPAEQPLAKLTQRPPTDTATFIFEYPRELGG